MFLINLHYSPMALSFNLFSPMALSFNLFSLLVLTATFSITIQGVFADDRKVYIVYMGALPENEYSPSAHHENVLEQVLEDSVPSKSLVRSYGKSFNAFAARLTENERQKLASMKGIVSVFPSNNIKLQTTRSWDFIGFPENVKRVPKFESDIVVGVIDTGIDPDSKSFSDEGFGPPPKKWKGACKGGQNFTCNNKIIGARFYTGDSTMDIEGHGTHTASTAAGNQVKNASFYGLASGKARGAVPSARIAAYKACENIVCLDQDILSSFDDAISDGVDVISISLGGGNHLDFYHDVIAIGAFHAFQKGILTVHSAGNDGPTLASVTSVAPWILTVAASTIDRKFENQLILGDGSTFVGKAINGGFDLKNEMYPLIYGGDAASSSCNSIQAGYCANGCLNKSLVRGKIVVCDSSDDPIEAFIRKAAGAIIRENGATHDFAFVYPLPTSVLDPSEHENVMSYLKSTRKPEARILKSETLKESGAPFAIPFSSRGPNIITPEILKPDVTAPGVDIIAAWPYLVSPSSTNRDVRHVEYNINSGTSMSCPHVTGAAAYVKSFHPDWSPSAIKSALMTTAYPLNRTKYTDGEFSYGAGHIDLLKAVNPGLVYEALEGDYVNMLCSLYGEEDVRLIVGQKANCPKSSKGSVKDLNYPSLASNTINANFTRTVKNVGAGNSTYTATITSDPALKVTVSPKVLSFKSLHEKKTFSVEVSSDEKTLTKLSSASLIWSDGVHTVRSPIVVYPDNIYVKA